MTEIKKEEEVTTPEAPETKVEAAPEEKKPESGEEKKEVSVSDALGQPGEEEKPKVTVPEAAFLDEKKGRKEAEAEVKRLQAELAARGQGNTPLSDSNIDSIAQEYDVNPEFLTKLSTALTAKAKKEIEAENKAKFDEMDRAAKKQNFDSTFDAHFNEIVKGLPEFKDVADKESVKAVVLEHLRSDDAKKKNTTLPQILEKMYGNATPGKRTIETAKPGGSKEPEPIDRARAAKDPEYAAELIKNPDTKKQYNEGMTDRLSRVL